MTSSKLSHSKKRHHANLDSNEKNNQRLKFLLPPDSSVLVSTLSNQIIIIARSRNKKRARARGDRRVHKSVHPTNSPSQIHSSPRKWFKNHSSSPVLVHCMDSGRTHVYRHYYSSSSLSSPCMLHVQSRRKVVALSLFRVESRRSVVGGKVRCVLVQY